MIAWDPSKPARFLRLLRHAELSFETALIVDDLWLRRATKQDVEDFKEGRGIFSAGLSLFGTPDEGDALIQLGLPASSQEDARRSAGEACERLVLALRLIKEGGVSLGPQLESQPDGRRELNESLLLSLRPDFGYLGGPLDLSRTDLDTLKPVYVGLNALPKEIQLAVDRFDMGARRRDRGDRFIDWWVALESLFGDKIEITYKLSLRIAYFIAHRDNRPTLARRLRKAYGARSTVLHGGVPKDMRIHEQTTVDALRQALTKLIVAGRAVGMEELDDYIAAGCEQPWPHLPASE